MKITLADLGIGNIHSLRKGLETTGASVHVTSVEADWLGARVLVLPGVGAFGTGAQRLDGVRERLRERLVNDRVPCLGVCLGLQLLHGRSDESPGSAGIGVFPGTVQRLQAQDDLKVPHMGWTPTQHANHPVFEGIPPGAHFYYVHSYFAEAQGTHVVATAKHGASIAAAEAIKNTLATQFHPEKSGRDGLRFLTNWVQLAEGAA